MKSIRELQCGTVLGMVISLFFQGVPMADASPVRVDDSDSLIATISAGKTKVVDLTQTLSDKTPTYEGKPDFKYETLTTVEKEGYATGAFHTHEHCGTHIDAPSHFVSGKRTIDRLEPANLILPAVVIDVRFEVNKDPDYTLTLDRVKAWEKSGYIPTGSAVLLLTGWSKRYQDASHYRNADTKGAMHFPGFSLEAAKYLVENHRVKALGIDTLSADCGTSEDFLVHSYALKQDLFLIENLTNLDALPARGALLFCGPLKIEGGTGSPARVMAIVPLAQINSVNKK
jgi:kynurenine formamidase